MKIGEAIRYFERELGKAEEAAADVTLEGKFRCIRRRGTGKVAQR